MQTSIISSSNNSSNQQPQTLIQQSEDHYYLQFLKCINIKHTQFGRDIALLKKGNITELHKHWPTWPQGNFEQQDVCEKILTGMYRAAFHVRSSDYSVEKAQATFDRAFAEAKEAHVNIFDYVTDFILEANNFQAIRSQEDPYVKAGFSEPFPYEIFQNTHRAAQKIPFDTTLHPSHVVHMQDQLALVAMNRQLHAEANTNKAYSTCTKETEKQLKDLKETVNYFGLLNGNHNSFEHIYRELQASIDKQCIRLYNADKASIEYRAFLTDRLFWEPLQQMMTDKKSPEEAIKSLTANIDKLIHAHIARPLFNDAARNMAARQLRHALLENAGLQQVFYGIQAELGSSGEDVIRHMGEKLGLNRELTWKILADHNKHAMVDENLGSCLATLLTEGFKQEFDSYFDALLNNQYRLPSNRVTFGGDLCDMLEYYQSVLLERCSHIRLPQLPDLVTTTVKYRPAAEALLTDIGTQHVTFNKTMQEQGRLTLPISVPQKYQVAALLLERASAQFMNELNGLLGTNFPSYKAPPVLPTTAERSIKSIADSFGEYEQALNDSFNASHLAQSNIDPNLPLYILPTILSKLEANQAGFIHERLAKLHAEMMQELGEKPPAERPISVKIDPKSIQQIKEINLTAGITLADVKKDNAASKQIDPKAAEAVQDLMDDIKAQTNDNAVRELFHKMSLDDKISTEVYQAFRDSWDKGDGSLIGKEYKENRVFITAEHTAKILVEARRLSECKKLDEALEKFKKDFIKDISQGAVTPRHTVIQSRYESFFSLVKSGFRWLTKTDQQHWQTGYKKIVCDTYLMEEMRKALQGAKKQAGGGIENKILEKLGKGKADDLQVRSERHDAEIKVLRNLMDGQGLVGEALENMERKVYLAKRDARLEASNLTATEIPIVRAMIEGFEEEYYKMMAAVQHDKETFVSLPPDYKAKHKQQLMKWKSERLEKKVKEEIVAKMNLMTDRAEFVSNCTRTPEEVKASISASLQPFMQSITDGTLNKNVEAMYSDNSAFIKKWGKYLVAEMIQGLDDEQECLVDGSCAGISTRMAVQDQRNPTLTVKELADRKVIEVKKQDTIAQAFHSVTNKIAGWFKKKNDTVAREATYEERAYPTGMRMALGIKNVKEITTVIGTKGEALPDHRFTQLKIQLEAKNRVLENSNGVLMMRLVFSEGAHRTYIRKDDKRAVYRLEEPNHGVFELPEKEMMYEIIKDLCLDYKVCGNPAYYIGLYQLEL